MRFIAARQELKLFQQQASQTNFDETAINDTNETTTAAQQHLEQDDTMVIFVNSDT